MADMEIPLGVLGSLLFSMMGPIALIPLFAGATAGADAKLQRAIALRAFLIALVALAAAVAAGAGALAGAGTSRSSLIIAAGLILTITALGNIFGWAKATGPAVTTPPSKAVAFMPIAIPGMVTPMGVAVLIIFVSYFPSLSDRISIMGVVTAIAVINLLSMLSAQAFMRRIGAAPLVVLGAIFGVLQVAMGIEMIVSGLIRSSLWQ